MASKGLSVYKQLAKAAAKQGPTKGAPRYMDGSEYRIGDEVLEGTVSYFRPAYEYEDQTVDNVRLVVVPRDGGVAVAVLPSQTRAVKRREQS